MIIKRTNLSYLKKIYLKTPLVMIILADVLLLSLLVVSFLMLLNPSSGKKLEVDLSETKASAQQIFKACTLKLGDDCYKEQFTPLVKEKGLKYAEQTVLDLQDLDPNIRHCHVLSHAISGIATRADPTKWKELLSIVNENICGAGFFHGIIEAYVGYHPDFVINKESIDEICNQGKKDFKESTCNHILGHLLVLENKGEIEPSLPVCNSLDTPRYQSECLNGIFMEDSFKPMLVDHGLAQTPVRDETRMIKQQTRCLKYSGKEGESCWTDLAEIFEEFYNDDAEKVYKKCHEAPYEAAARACYFKAATLMSVSHNFNTTQQLTSTCTMFIEKEEDYRQCTSSMISGLMYYSAKFTDRGLLLCNNVPDKFKDYCFTDLGQKLTWSVPERDQREQYCKEANPKYHNLCVGK